MKVFYVGFIFVMIASLAAVGLAPGIGSTSSGRHSTAPIDDDEPPVETPSVMEPFPDGPLPVIDASESHEAVLMTDRGEIVILLNPDAPKAANSFAYLAAENFYDGLEFFWVYRDRDGGYSAQAGDPTCAGSGEFSCNGNGSPGYTLPKEAGSTEAPQWAVIAPVTIPGGDQVHGSQFVVALRDGVKAEGTVIGEVIEGRDVLESLQSRTPCFDGEPSDSNPCQPDDELTEPLTIIDVEVRPA